MSPLGAARQQASPALSQYVLKVHSRCDLACDHCYIYEHADQSWIHRPRAMAPDTVRVAAQRIADHVAAHVLRQVHVVLHGGEPLLLGVDRLRATIEELRRTVEPVARLDLRLQSNGVLLTPAICDLFVEHGVKVGISLDGDRLANDRHRRFANGASSHAHVLRALSLLRRPEYRVAYAGILCTIDVANDPIRVYEALLAEDPPHIEFLFPHATWDLPPSRPGGAAAPYADWLRRIHKRWVADGRSVPIRLFDALRSTAAGGPSGTEALGLDPADLIVIETDGAWEQADSMKTAFGGAAATGFDIFSHTVDEAAAHPGIAHRQTGVAHLCDTCRACPVVQRCGGGLFAHRYRTGNGFDNPSVYCADLKELILSTDQPAPAPADAVQLFGALSPEILDELATGHGSAATIESIAAEQLSITRDLLSALADRVAGGSVAQAWDLLMRLDAMAPDAVRTVLAHPYVRVWAVECLRRPDHGDLGHFGALAAATAIRAGQDAELLVPVRAGTLYLPTLGGVAFGPQVTGTAVVSTNAEGFVVRAGDHAIPVGMHRHAAPPSGWWPAKRLHTDGWTVVLEDTDPYRDCHTWPVTVGLGAEETRGWADALAGAWAAVRRDAPAYVEGIQAGLSTITPLAVDPGGRLRSACARDAFGAVSAALTGADPLATLLVHEFQHVKLGAVLDRCNLFDPECPSLLDVGWRDDPRPVEGALQGTYAHLGLADVWRARPGAQAREVFHRYHAWTVDAVDELLASGALTVDGERFVRGMGQTLAGWLS